MCFNLFKIKGISNIIELTEILCFKQDDAISILNGHPLKLAGYLTYHGSNISSTESDVNLRIGKAWIAIDSLSIIWKSNDSDKVKGKLFQGVAVSKLLYGGTNKNARWELHYDAAPYKTTRGCCTPQNCNCTATYLSSHKLSKYDEPDMLGTAGETGTNGRTHKQCSFLVFHSWMHQCWPISKNLHSSTLHGHQMQSRGRTKSNSW